MNSPKIFIIILNWNGLKDTSECLGSVKKIDYPDYQVIVVDNGSCDGSSQIISQRFPQVKLICSERNEGFARGNNIGIRSALSQNADYILLLNNDTVVDHQILNHFVDIASKYPQAKIFGPKIYIYQEPEKICWAGIRWKEDELEFEFIGYGVRDEGFIFNEVKEVLYVVGCALFFEAKIISEIGFLDEKFFNNSEDVDFCFRARKAGYQCLFVPQAKIWHKGGVSFGGWDSPFYAYFYWRNYLLWAGRYLSFRQHLRLWLKSLYTLLHSLRIYFGLSPRTWLHKKRISSNQRILSKAIIQGILDYLLRRFEQGPKWLTPKSL